MPLDGMTLVAVGIVENTAGTPTFVRQNGGFVETIQDADVGDIIFTLQEPLDPNAAYVEGTSRGGGVAETMTWIVGVNGSGQTEIQVLCERGGVAADFDLNLAVYRIDDGA